MCLSRSPVSPSGDPVDTGGPESPVATSYLHSGLGTGQEGGPCGCGLRLADRNDKLAPQAGSFPSRLNRSKLASPALHLRSVLLHTKSPEPGREHRNALRAGLHTQMPPEPGYTHKCPQNQAANTDAPRAGCTHRCPQSQAANTNATRTRLHTQMPQSQAAHTMPPEPSCTHKCLEPGCYRAGCYTRGIASPRELGA